MWFALALIFLIPCLAFYVAFRLVLLLVWGALELTLWAGHRAGVFR